MTMKRIQVVLMALIFLAFAVTSIFIFPQADDYEFGARVLDLGFWGAQVREYTSWCGRYTASFLQVLSPLVWGRLSDYRLIPPLMLVLLYLSSVFFVWKIFGSKLYKNEVWTLGLGFAFLTLTGYRTTAEDLYWFAGSATYTSAIILLNVTLAFLWSEKKTSMTYYVCSFWAFLLIGTNETTMVLWLYLLSLTIGYNYLSKRKIHSGLIVTFIISAVSTIIVIKSPGNALRAAQFEKSHQVVRTVSNALLYSFIDPFKFLTIPLVIYCIVNFERLKQLIWFGPLTTVKKRYLLLVMMGLFFLSFAPSLWGMGRRPNERTMTVIFHTYMLILFPLIFVWVKEVPGKIRMKYLPLLLIVSVPTYNLARDYLSGDIFTYHLKWQKSLSSKGAIDLDNVTAPKTIHFKFLSPDYIYFPIFERENPEFFN